MPRQHHLLAVTSWLLKAGTGFSLFVAALLIIALGAVGVAAMNPELGIPPDQVLGGVPRTELLAMATIPISAGLICFILVATAFRSTTRIVEAARSGDPFVNENADRLDRIGWLLLAVTVIGFATQRAIDWIVPGSLQGHVNFVFDVSPIGLIAILLIFVLARIFRVGSDMRAELEGTI